MHGPLPCDFPRPLPRRESPAGVRNLQLRAVVAAAATILTLGFGTAGCYIVSYAHPQGPPLDVRQRPETLQYQAFLIPGLVLGDANQGLRDGMQHNHVFRRSVEVRTEPATGTYVEVYTQGQDPSFGSLAWGYVSLSLFHILPAYSGSGGFWVQFRVLHDKRETHVYRYLVRRQVFAWLPLLPLLWINALTTSEYDAMKSTVETFFADAIREGAFDSLPAAPPPPPAATPPPYPPTPPPPAVAPPSPEAS